MNIIRDTAYKIENWNITKTPYIIKHKFGRDTQGYVKIKDLHFVSETAGLIHFIDSPDEKSSIYYFSLASKS